MNEKKEVSSLLSPPTLVLIWGYIIIFSRVVSNPYEVNPIEKKEFLAVQPLPATKIPMHICMLFDVMRWIANARTKSKFAS